MDDFLKRYLAVIKEAQSDEDLVATVDAIYHDGFEDGANEGREDSE